MKRADTVVQPDLMIVCDPSQCREEGVFGAPTWVLEILSAATAWKDQTDKKQLYQECGVTEYWIFNPDNLDLIIYRREGERFGPPVGANLAEPVNLGVPPPDMAKVHSRDLAAATARMEVIISLRNSW